MLERRKGKNRDLKSRANKMIIITNLEVATSMILAIIRIKRSSRDLSTPILRVIIINNGEISNKPNPATIGKTLNMQILMHRAIQINIANTDKEKIKLIKNTTCRNMDISRSQLNSSSRSQLNPSNKDLLNPSSRDQLNPRSRGQLNPSISPSSLPLSGLRTNLPYPKMRIYPPKIKIPILRNWLTNWMRVAVSENSSRKDMIQNGKI